MSLIRRFAPIASLLALVVSSLAVLAAAPTPPLMAKRSAPPLTVHEWGTFTSIGAPDGSAERWSPLAGSEDLPCFVERFSLAVIKGTLGGTIRMETPVLYFYAPDEISVNVNVRFRRGAITEWYPSAAVTPRAVSPEAAERPAFESRATWTNVRVTPGAVASDLKVEPGNSHYYLARETDAAPVQVGAQQEKFLFYRGIGNFQPPVSAAVTGDRIIIVKSTTGEPLGDLIVFENRDGKTGYQVAQFNSEREATLLTPILTAGASLPTAELEQILIAHGLFPREAKAMVDTWRDSWFEDGVRLFYLAPRSAIDAALPLEITPAPSEIARAFVGRIELITPRIVTDARRAIDDRDTAKLLKYGRFMQNITERILEPLRRTRPAPIPGVAVQLTPEEERVWDALRPAYDAQWKARRPCESRPALEERTTQLRRER